METLAQRIERERARQARTVVHYRIGGRWIEYPAPPPRGDSMGRGQENQATRPVVPPTTFPAR